MGALVLKSFKVPSLAKFDGRGDPHEHVASINTYREIIIASDSLKGKLLSITFRVAKLWWYISLPQISITGYYDLVKKLAHQFAHSRHMKMSTTNLFNILQGSSESLRDYPSLFNEATIKVAHPN